jgi:hypothetical protein
MPTLNDRLESWLTEEASEATSELFASLLRPALRAGGGSPTAPCSEEEWGVIRSQLKDWLSEMDLALSDLEQAAEETRRARREGKTFRDWMKEAFRRHLSEDQAEISVRAAVRRIEQIPEANDPDAPPQPEDVLTYRILLDAIGGGASLAAAQEKARRLGGGLPTN